MPCILGIEQNKAFCTVDLALELKMVVQGWLSNLEDFTFYPAKRLELFLIRCQSVTDVNLCEWGFT
jgi:hypothetical protein